MIAQLSTDCKRGVKGDMSLGTERSENMVSIGDTHDLITYAYTEDEVPTEASDIVEVNFTVRLPDGTTEALVGEIQSDGSGYSRYQTTALSPLGEYVWVAQFTFVTGDIKTFPSGNFVVFDPLNPPPITREREIGQEVWMRLEDCFDSEEGGPWLRDMTLAYFEPSKVERFIAEGLLLINQYPPTTNLDLGFFTEPTINTDPLLPPETYQADPDRHIIVQATLIAVIKHLMRSYVEQPNLVSGNAVWQDRRDYLQRWQSVLTAEQADFKFIVTLWKRQFLDLGKGALLTHSKAGRLYPTGWRARNAMRGYY
jgi:hypothetical protein